MRGISKWHIDKLPQETSKRSKHTESRGQPNETKPDLSQCRRSKETNETIEKYFAAYQIPTLEAFPQRHICEICAEIVICNEMSELSHYICPFLPQLQPAVNSEHTHAHQKNIICTLKVSQTLHRTASDVGILQLPNSPEDVALNCRVFPRQKLITGVEKGEPIHSLDDMGWIYLDLWWNYTGPLTFRNTF